MNAVTFGCNSDLGFSKRGVGDIRFQEESHVSVHDLFSLGDLV